MLLGVADHAGGDAVFHTAGGVVALHFDQDGGVDACRHAIEPDELGVADEAANVAGGVRLFQM
jgi:ribulose 1,5-bisphosphate carboxylase large subunit-like protein